MSMPRLDTKEITRRFRPDAQIGKAGPRHADARSLPRCVSNFSAVQAQQDYGILIEQRLGQGQHAVAHWRGEGFWLKQAVLQAANDRAFFSLEAEVIGRLFHGRT